MSDRDAFRLLKDKDIIKILDGDISFGEYKFPDGSTTSMMMPYLSGRMLCDISTTFGLIIEYNATSEKLSRWEYLSNLLEHCIVRGKVSALLAYLLDKRQFAKDLAGRTAAEITQAHRAITDTVIGKINGMLSFKGHELCVYGNNFIIREISDSIEVSLPEFKIINHDYVKSMAERAMADVSEGNYDSALSKSRTLLEEIFIYLIDQKNEIPSKNGNVMTLFKQVSSLYNIHADKDTDKRLNKLISGLHSIVDAIGELRNNNSDAHGVGMRRVTIKEYHARLAVNSAVILAEFMLSVEKNASRQS